MKRSALTQLEWADRLSPRICRLIARCPGLSPRTAMTNREIARASGLGFCRVVQMSKLDSWASCTCWERQQFMAACGITPDKELAARRYVLRQRRNLVAFPHLWKGGLCPKYLKKLLK